MQAEHKKTSFRRLSVIFPAIFFSCINLEKNSKGHILRIWIKRKGKESGMEQNEIKKIIAEQLAKGISLSDIHKLLYNEHKVRMTFMDMRLMASEIESIDWSKSDADAEAKAAPKVDNVEVPGDDEEVFDEDEEMPEEEMDNAPSADGEGSSEKDSGKLRGTTSVEVNKIARPGAVLSGSVKFGSGASAEWVLDQLGRIALTNAKGKPDEEDIKEFQAELQKAVSHGY